MIVVTDRQILKNLNVRAQIKHLNNIVLAQTWLNEISYGSVLIKTYLYIQKQMPSNGSYFGSVGNLLTVSFGHETKHEDRSKYETNIKFLNYAFIYKQTKIMYF